MCLKRSGCGNVEIELNFIMHVASLSFVWLQALKWFEQIENYTTCIICCKKNKKEMNGKKEIRSFLCQK